MNYKDALEKLEKLLDGYKEQFLAQKIPTNIERVEELAMLYGEVEEIINRFAGIDKVDSNPGYVDNGVYPNFIAATLLSGHNLYRYQGYTQLSKVIGKVKQYANDPTIPQIEYSVTNLIQILRRFRECCQYLTSTPQNEPDVQSILWIMLRSQFDRLEKEETLPHFGSKNYRPDFGLPDLRVLVETKFIGSKTAVSDIQEQILGDIPGYLNDATNYDSIIILVYDAAQKLRDSRQFIEDLKTVEGIVDVIIVPGIG